MEQMERCAVHMSERRATATVAGSQAHHTSLHKAAMVGNRDGVAALIKGGCALDLQDKDGNTALHEAAWHGFSPCVKLLVKAGADVHIKNKAGNTALHLSSQNGHNHSARFLLLGGSLPDTKNHVGDTCLHVASRYNQLAMIKVLLSTLCSVAEKNESGDTALHVAAALNHKKTVNLLLGAGADSCIKNNAGQTAVDKAREHNHREMAMLLAKVDQGHRLARTRTVVRRRDQLKMARRVQSVPRDDAPAAKGEAGSANENDDSHSSDQALNQRIEMVSKAAASPRNRRKLRRLKDRADAHLRREAQRRRARSASPVREDDVAFANGRAYQLYTLYRDKDGNVKQAPASDCHCKPLIKKLENQLKATKQEMRTQIQDIHLEMNTKLGRLDRQSKHQSIKAGDVGNWPLSKIQDIKVHLPADHQYFKLLPSPSVDQSLMEADPECLPLLSVVSDDSIGSLATYVNVLPSPTTLSPFTTTTTVASATARMHGLDDVIGRKYYEVKRDNSTEDQLSASDLRSAIPSLHLPLGHMRHGSKVFPRPRTLSSDARWRPVELHLQEAAEDSPTEAQAGGSGAAGSSRGGGRGVDEYLLSTPTDSLSPSSRPPGGDSDLDEALAPRVSAVGGISGMGGGVGGVNSICGGVGSGIGAGIGMAGVSGGPGSVGGGGGGGGGGAGGAVKPMEFFGERLAEMSFIQERDNLHAVEVTQRFFETVSTQLERWYERKIQEAQRQAEQRANLDRNSLMERISNLEEELQNLRANSQS
ncbi:ankyrin repeat domain-containing protein 6 [Engraulis encrasicolus]|uniref:ankyrin repeat domain-containing protein 6 n=1 Tax=Engraulis encrasicolus TaxID=184585 RepID=UPI002FCF3818